MSIGDFIGIQPSELKFPFELKKQSSCYMQLSNKTDQYIAFKVKTTNPKKYCVGPNAGVVLPNSACNVRVTLQAQEEAPLDMQCRDKFLVQSVVAPQGASSKDVTQEMFTREDGKIVDEFRLRVVYIPANPPSPVPEGEEEATSPETSLAEDEIRKPVLSEVFLSIMLFLSVPFNFISVVSKLNEEKASVTKENKKLLRELELIKNQTRKRQGNALSFVVLIFGLLLGILVGYVITGNPTNTSGKCPVDTLKLGICGDWVGLVHEVVGTKPSSECCELLKGLADFEAALCLCTEIKANVLGIAKVKVPIALSLAVNSCGKKVPRDFVCS
ncbi:Vesicle-associated protein 1-3 [Striga hermonthica]|uniref:Vesicle-associated protein 1-3 n=1 Tax=Striga hermonthica TaxID=68872 RepID=A0A9N7P3C2_STRHE|nr:Vesicle-associated protein 1-3 [Striga hermonthica]